MAGALGKVGKYHVLRNIGHGAMGEVWLAHDPLLGRDVAIKTISTREGLQEEARKRFLREAQSAARLNHPNIVTIYEFGEEQDRIYMAMELLEGEDLKALIGADSLGDLDERLRLLEQICDGLAFAHSKDIIHRDLKPANIHVQRNRHVKIMDFGLARLGRESDMTRAGAMLGTPHYMSPEQVRGERTDARSDIFALGTIAYELLTRRKAFDGPTTPTVLYRVVQHQPEPVRRAAPEVPPVLARVVERAMSKDPALRFQAATEMRQALRVVRRVLSGELSEGAARELVDPGAFDATVVAEPSAGGATLLDTSRAAAAGAETRAARSRAGDSVRTLPPVPKALPSRTLAYAGALTAVLAALLAAGYFVFLRQAPPAPAPAPRDVSKEQVGALTEALVASQVELAQENLKDKNYRGALAQAQRVVAVDPRNAEAKRVLQRAKAILAELQAAAGEARSALRAGDGERASRALSKVLSIDPNDPVVEELSGQLDRYFQSQAEEARRAMAGARTAAEESRAGSEASFGEGSGRAQEAETALTNGQFAAATRRFLEARDLFERSRRAAVAAAAVAAATPRPAPATVAAAPSTVPPVTIAAARPTPPPRVITAPATPAPFTAAPPPLPRTEEPAIRKLVEEYGRAIQSKDIALFKTVKPNLSGEEERRFREIFKAVKQYRVGISILSVKTEGSKATVRVARQDTIDGRAVNFQQTLGLVKGPAGWTLQEIGQ